MGTEDKPVSLEARNRGVAIATGLLPDKDAIYLTAKHEAQKGKTYKAVYRVPQLRDPKLGFYSITIYGDDQAIGPRVHLITPQSMRADWGWRAMVIFLFPK